MAFRFHYLRNTQNSSRGRSLFTVFKNAFLMLILGMSWQSYAAVVAETSLPAVSVKDGGELVLNADKIDYRAWQSQQLTGKVYVIQHIAGRSSAKALNAPLIDRIKAENLPKDRYQTVTVVNTDDAIWGTGGIVKGKLESSKKEFPWSMMVLDKEGVALSVWGLKEKSSAVIVVDTENRVRWVKDGALTDHEQQEVMALIRRLLK
ncbi:YtfJ family protein [Oceanospirillum sp.]|uniref:YtfJ family protein n=1 Tax=Oceanospirillum sp. TaxID=2021254 RepID=UPI003A8D3763